MKTYPLFALFACAVLSGCNSQNTLLMQPNHSAHQGHAQQSGALAHTTAYIAAMNKMHQTMHDVDVLNADKAFVLGMIPHHQGAIDMANIQLTYGTDTKMRALAQQIIDAQTQEIALMQQWLKQNPTVATDSKMSKVLELMQAKDDRNHHAMMMGIQDKRPDVAFVKGMIPHHQSAIDMADMELQYGQDPALQALAKHIKQDQTLEIAMMQQWLMHNS